LIQFSATLLIILRAINNLSRNSSSGEQNVAGLENQFGEPNQGISTPRKCLLIPSRAIYQWKRGFKQGGKSLKNARGNYYEATVGQCGGEVVGTVNTAVLAFFPRQEIIIEI
jgi:hypothetical protein